MPILCALPQVFCIMERQVAGVPLIFTLTCLSLCFRFMAYQVGTNISPMTTVLVYPPNASMLSLALPSPVDRDSGQHQPQLSPAQPWACISPPADH